MAKYLIPVTWRAWGIIEVEASTLAEAETKTLVGAALPQESEYIDDSLLLDKECAFYGEIIEWAI